MKRVMIIGGPGSGKSTLANKLFIILDLTVTHMDTLYWDRYWVLREHKKVLPLIEGAARKDTWIIEGNYLSFPEGKAVRLDRADTLIFLDFPTWALMINVLKRTLKYYGKTRPDMPEGCKERFDWEFFKFVALYNQKNRHNRISLLEESQEGKCVYHLKSRREVNEFLQKSKTA